MNSATRSVLFIVPGKITRLTGGSLYDKNLADSLIEHGFRLEIASIPDLPYFAGLISGCLVAPILLLRLIWGRHDIVIEDGWVQPAALLFNIACRLSRRAQLVIIVHQVRWQRSSITLRFIARKVERASLRSADLIVTVSSFINRGVKQLIGGKAYTIIAPPGSDAAPSICPDYPKAARENIETDATPLRLLFVGNCTRVKGLDYLIGALAMLDDLCFELDIVGDVTFAPRYYNQVKQLAKRLNVEDRVKFHGTIPQERLALFYSEADIFTFPSLYEGFGIVLVEAMRAGLPIVTTRVGAVDEIVREGENALVVPSGDSKALARAIRMLSTDPTMRKRYGQCSHKLAQMLPTWKQTCEEISYALEHYGGRTKNL